MGSWDQVVTVEQREKYNELLKNSDKAYETANMKGLNRLLTERKGIAFIYTEDAPANFQFLLLITPANDGSPRLKIVNAIPIGEFESADSLKIGWTKVREVLDETGFQEVYGTPVKEYDDTRINQLFKITPKYIWEFVSNESSTNERHCYTFKRTAERKNEDSLFIGPGEG